uniref:BEN domain-containing protein n=1 Tax=Anopheles dirus TaxID=7168 RepID=A0A182NKW8_9DIPT
VAKFIRSQKKCAQLVFEGYIYNRKIVQQNGRTTWRCSELLKYHCKATCVTKLNQLISIRRDHNHADHAGKIAKKLLYDFPEDLEEYMNIHTRHPIDVTNHEVDVIDDGADFKVVLRDQSSDSFPTDDTMLSCGVAATGVVQRMAVNGRHLFLTSRKGGLQLVHDNYIYRSNLRRQGRNRDVIYWECVYNRGQKCRGRLKTIGNVIYVSNGKDDCKDVLSIGTRWSARPSYVEESDSKTGKMLFVRSPWGRKLLVYDGYTYCTNKRVQATNTTYWRCTMAHRRHVQSLCESRCTVRDGRIVKMCGKHNHAREMLRLDGKEHSAIVQPSPPTVVTVAPSAAVELKFIKSPWSTPCLVLNNYLYNCHSTRGDIGYWRCHNYSRKVKEERCRARCVVKSGRLSALTGAQHNHPPHTEKIERIARRNHADEQQELLEVMRVQQQQQLQQQQTKAHHHGGNILLLMTTATPAASNLPPNGAQDGQSLQHHATLDDVINAALPPVMASLTDPVKMEEYELPTVEIVALEPDFRFRTSEDLDAGGNNPDGHLFIPSQRGLPLLAKDNFIYRCERTRNHRSYWLCIRYKEHKCTGRIICQNNAVLKETEHCHADDRRRLLQSEQMLVDLCKINVSDWVKAVHPRYTAAAARRVTSASTHLSLTSELEFIYSQRGYPLLVVDSFLFRKNRDVQLFPVALSLLGKGVKPVPKVWYTAPLTFVTNRRGTQNLHFAGYVYVRKKSWHRTTNWACCKGNLAAAPVHNRGKRRDVFIYDLAYEMINNRKGGLNLHFRGYVYRRKTNFSQTTNWVCANPMTSRNDNAIAYAGPCAARCVTNGAGGIRFSKKWHNHGPIAVIADQGVWLPGLPYQLAPDSRGNRMYLFGYSFRKAASFRSTSDWVCVRNEQRNRCQARLVHRMVDGALKLNRHKHNHEPEKGEKEPTRTTHQQGTAAITQRGAQCNSYVVADTYSVDNVAPADDEDPNENVAVFSTTMRGKEQLLYMGQPFVFEKLVLTGTGERKKIWRCNQWWNQKCRARVYTVDRLITPLNRYHTHKDIVRRKQRVVKRNSDSVAVDVKRNVSKAIAVSKPDAKNRLSKKVTPSAKRKIINKVPLHAGSSVYIATKDLLAIYTSKPAIYTRRLMELMFGTATLQHSCLDSSSINEASDGSSTNLVPLDPTILESVITHVVHVFQQQKHNVTASMVKNFIRDRLELVRAKVTRSDGGDNGGGGGSGSDVGVSVSAERRSSSRGMPYIPMDGNDNVSFTVAATGARQLIYKNFGYHRNLKMGDTEYWRCSMALRLKCRATIATKGNMMRVNDVEHNHVPMRRLLYGLGVNGKRNLKRAKEEFFAKKQLIRLRGKLYQKTRGRAYRSTWMCIEYGCPGEIVLFELKGESARYIVGVRGSRKLKIGNYSFTKNKECMDKTYWSCDTQAVYIVGQRGSILLYVNGHRYVKNRQSQSKTYWICAKKGSLSCRARITTALSEYDSNTPNVILSTANVLGMVAPLEQTKPSPTPKRKLRCKTTERREQKRWVPALVVAKSPPKSTPTKVKTENDETKSLFRKNNTPVTMDKSKISYIYGRGNNVLIYEGHRYIKNNMHGGRLYWKCSKWHTNCKARAITLLANPNQCVLKNLHNHDSLPEDVTVDLESKNWKTLSYMHSSWHPMSVSAQEHRTPQFSYKQSQRSGRHLLVVNGITFFRNRRRNGKQYWKCNQYYKCKCPCIVVIDEATTRLSVKHFHNHTTPMSTASTTSGATSGGGDVNNDSRGNARASSSSVVSFPRRLLVGIDDGNGGATVNRSFPPVRSSGAEPPSLPVLDRYESLSTGNSVSHEAVDDGDTIDEENMTGDPHIEIYATKSFRGRPAIIVDKQKYLLMSENSKRIVWRCSSMATNKLKCPARIIQYKDTDQYTFPTKSVKRVKAESKDLIDSSWLVVDRSDIQYTTTQRGRTMLNFGGYRFVENRQSKRNIFWRCACYVKHSCRAACVTSKSSFNEQLIRLTGLAHSHPPEVSVKPEGTPERKRMVASKQMMMLKRSISIGMQLMVEGEEETYTLYPDTGEQLQLDLPDLATFGVSQRGAKKLIYNRYEYVKDREFPESINWRCALFKRFSCRARAVTREINDGFQRAKFGITRRGHQMLMYRGHRYVREKQKGAISNWKCSWHSRYRCKARAVTRALNGQEMMRLTHEEHTHDPFPEVTRHTRWTFVPATFGKTRRGQLKLLYDGHAYTRDRQSVKTCNWKCSLFTRYRCRARAVTKDIDDAKGDGGGGLERATFEFTSRGTQCLVYDGYFYSRNKTFENGTRVNWKCRFYHRLQCKARAQTRLIGSVEYVKVFKNEHSHPQEVKSMRRRKRKIKLSFPQHQSATAAHMVAIEGAVTPANFSLTQRGRPLLVHDGYTYIRNGEFLGTINWRCSCHRRKQCKAKAITEKRAGKEYVRLSHPEHNHLPRGKKRYHGQNSDDSELFTTNDSSNDIEEVESYFQPYVHEDYGEQRCSYLGDDSCGMHGDTLGAGSFDTIVFVHLPLKNKVVRKIYHNGFYYCRSKSTFGATYWVCDRSKQDNCRSRITTFDDKRTYKRGKPKLVIENNSFFRTKGDNLRAYWSCSAYKSKKCRCKLVTHRGSYTVKYTNKQHTHPDEYSSTSSITPLDADIDDFYKKQQQSQPAGAHLVKFATVAKQEPKAYRQVDDDEDETFGMEEHKFALDLRLETGSKGRPKLIMGGYSFFRNNSSNNKTYWLCSKNRLIKCRARIITLDGCSGMILKNQHHNHPPTEY